MAPAGGIMKYISLRFVLQCLSIYAAFLCWGYLQEKITSHEYVLSVTGGGKDGKGPVNGKFVFTFTLNFFMAFAGCATAATLDFFDKGNKPSVSLMRFWKAALTCAAASPIGYASLQYINYPLMVLTKTMKPVPVLVVGVVVYQNRYPWYQYVTVLCLSGGLAMYTFASSPKGSGGGDHKGGGAGGAGGKGGASAQAAADTMVNLAMGIPGVITVTIVVLKAVWGIVLVCINLLLDGYTNNEQDEIFAQEKVTGLQMMKYTNLWQIWFIALYLLCGWGYYGQSSELSESMDFMKRSPDIQRDVALFCVCAGIGQVLVFKIMEEHGSLVWITISITRKLATILVSVLVFQHALNAYQYAGIFLVFGGITLYTVKKQQDQEAKKSKKIKEN